MRRYVATIGASIVLMFGLATAAFANTVTITFQNINSHDDVYANAYAGIYEGKVNGTSAQFVCDDFLREIHNGDSWSAYVNSNNPVTTGPTGVKFDLTNISNPDLTNSVDPDFIGTVASQQEEYNMVAWLVDQIFDDPSNSSKDWGAYAGAIWSLTDGAWNNASYTQAYGGGLTAYEALSEAYSHRDDTDLEAFNVYTPDPLNAGQEFFSPAAEPATFVLLGLTVLAACLLGRFGLLQRP